MENALNFLHNLYHYLVDTAPALAIGFVISGIIYEMLPGTLISKYLSGRGFRPILYATITGIFLPVCCLGSLPIAITLHRRGAKLGPVLSFLIATPATSLTAIFVTYLFSAIFGLLMYMCLTAGVPIVHAFIHQELAAGAGLVMLILGPVTSYGALLAIRKKFGIKTVLVYLLIIILVSLCAGYAYTIL